MYPHHFLLIVSIRSIYAALWVTPSKVRGWDVQVTEDLCGLSQSLSLEIWVSLDWLLWCESKSIVGSRTIFTKELFLLKNKSLNFIQRWGVALGILLLVTDALLLVTEAVLLVKVVEWDLSSSVVGLAIADKWMGARVIAVVWSTTSSWLELFIVNLEVVWATAIYSSASIDEWLVFTLHVLVAKMQQTANVVRICAGHWGSCTRERRGVEIWVSLELVIWCWKALDGTVEVDVIDSHGLASILFCY